MLLPGLFGGYCAWSTGVVKIEAREGTAGKLL